MGCTASSQTATDADSEDLSQMEALGRRRRRKAARKDAALRGNCESAAAEAGQTRTIDAAPARLAVKSPPVKKRDEELAKGSFRMPRMFNVRRARTSEPQSLQRSRRRLSTSSDTGAIPQRASAARPKRQLTTSCSAALRLRKEWLDEEGRVNMNRTVSDTAMFRAQLTGMMGDLVGDQLGRSQIRELFSRAMGNIDDMLFDKIFALFDVDDDGLVHRDDFLVAMTFLTQKGSATDNVELAFRLFDVDANGRISQTEFNTMVYSIVGNRLKYALQTEHGRQAFKDHMKREWSAESVEFWEAVSTLCELYGDQAACQDLYKTQLPRKGDGKPDTRAAAATEQAAPGIPISVAQTVFEQYIAAEAPDQINIGSSTHESIVDAITRARNQGEETVPIDSFKRAAQEIMQLMEQDNFERFRERLAKEAVDLSGENFERNYAQEAWARFEMGPDEAMPLETFRRWASENQGYFAFLEELQTSFSALLCPPDELEGAESGGGGGGGEFHGVAASDAQLAQSSGPTALAHATKESGSSRGGLLRESSRKGSLSKLLQSVRQLRHQASSGNSLDPHSPGLNSIGEGAPAAGIAPEAGSMSMNETQSSASQALPSPIDADGDMAGPSTLDSPLSSPVPPMPRRLYHRAMTSMVSMSFEQDACGNQVRVITLGLGAQPSMVSSPSCIPAPTGVQSASSSCPSSPPRRGSGRPLKLPFRRAQSDLSDSGLATGPPTAAESCNSEAGTNTKSDDDGSLQLVSGAVELDNVDVSNNSEDGDEMTASGPDTELDDGDLTSVASVDRDEVTSPVYRHVRQVSRPDDEAYLRHNSRTSVTVLRFKQSHLTFC